MLKKAFEFAESVHLGKVKEDCVYDNRGGAGILYKIDDNAIYLAFAGLNDADDLTAIGNSDIRLKYGTINSSILERYLEIYSILPEFPTNLPMYISGYSLGGAIAFLFALLNMEKYNIDSVYSFGSPKFSKIDTRLLVDTSKVKSKFVRVIVKHDPVAMYPLFGDWFHFGESLVLNDNKKESKFYKLVRILHLGEYNNWVNLLYLLLFTVFSQNQNHDLNTYRRLIND